MSHMAVNGTTLWYDIEGSAGGAGHFTWLDAPDHYFDSIAGFVSD
jgi:hypothetical protein